MSNNRQQEIVINESTPLLQTEQQQQQQRNQNAKSEAFGLILMTLSALAFSTMSLFVKLSGAAFASFEIVAARSIVQAVLGLIGCYMLGINPLGKPGVRKWLFIRGFVGSTGLALFFYSITQLPLADATVVFFLSPTFTAILAAIILGEAFTFFDGLCATLCMAGAILVSKPTFLFGGDDMETDSLQRALAVLAALVGALMAAIAYVTVRKIGKGAHFLVHTVYFGIISTVTSIPMLFAFQEYVAPEGWKEYGMLLMTGVLAFIGQCLLNNGLQLAPAGPGTLMRMNDVAFAFAFGILILHEYPDVYSVTGALLVVGTTVAMGVKKWHKSKQQ
ncbi:hypothetical protein K492DRAFT_147515 [Lichtheimia hyalospora FSU 10163]|nr:hypothetical protein K492DRAFT_147515 [Lichtheimia hyalospora FSU 10163]